MKLEIKTNGDLVVFDLCGSVDILDHSGFDSAMKKVFQQKKTKKILLDCTKLEYLSSSGLKSFIAAYQTAMEEGVLMAVCGVHGSVSYAFDVTGFGALLNICRDKEEALQFLKDS